MSTVRHRAPRRLDRRKVVALLSSLSVLGVGAGVTTLASWHQTLEVNGTGGTLIGTSSFCVEESVDGSVFVAGAVGSTGTALTFTPTAAVALSPGDALFAYVRFRTCASSTRPGLLSLTGVTGNTGPLAAYLTYGVVGNVASSSACSASAFATPATANVLAPASTSLATSAAPTAQAITLPAGSGAAGASVGVCFEVALSQAPTAAQGTAASPTWTFDAQSS